MRTVFLVGSSITAVVVSLLLLSVLSNCSPLFGQAGKRRDAPAARTQNAGFRFASGHNALNIPLDLSNNLLLSKVRVNGSEPIWFIFDTGASASILNERVAKKLGLKAQGKETGTATGGAIEAELFTGISLSLPGVTLFNQTVASIPLDGFAPLLGRPIGGIIGYDFFKQFVVEIDYQNRKINVHAPTHYKYRGEGAALRLRYINNKPFIRADVTPPGRGPISGIFMIDTGADGALVLNRPFVQAHQLLKSLTEIKRANTGGVGGASSSITSRVKEIRLSKFVINDPLVSFSQATEGAGASADYDGLLGAEIFLRFNLILDHSRRRIILESNARLSEPIEEDMSGIELIAAGDDLGTFVIDDVAAQSPAAGAGLKVEDVLTAIEGRPIAEFSLYQIRQMFRQEGKEYHLSVKRGDQVLQVKMKLRRLI